MPLIAWDEGTAYDLFVSLYVLHRPTSFGLRPSWAAGVRSRLPTAQREVLEKVQSFLPVPLRWLFLLPAEAKTTDGALRTLAQQPADERLPSLLFTTDTPTEAIDILRHIALRQSWSSAEQEKLRAILNKRGIHPRPAMLNNVCEAWSDLTAYGEQYLQALQTYVQVFFAEEEARIKPSLLQASEQARKMAASLPAVQLLERLTHGVHFETAETSEKIILTPSFWVSPLAIYNQVQPGTLLVLYGSRAEGQGLIPGDHMPDGLVEALKALSDPTRLRILRYLAECPHSPSQLARRLRLRPPTVVHHLNILRLAGLVEVMLHSEGERAYALRREALEHVTSHLHDFIELP